MNSAEDEVLVAEELVQAASLELAAATKNQQQYNDLLTLVSLKAHLPTEL